MSFSDEEFANATLKLVLSKFLVLPLKSFRIPRQYLSIHPRSHTISTTQYVGDTCRANEKGQGHVRPISSVKQFFTSAINTPPHPSLHFLLRSFSLSRSSFSNPSAAATPSLSVRKSFTTSTSSPSYSRRPRISSLRRRCSCLPLPS